MQHLIAQQLGVMLEARHLKRGTSSGCLTSSHAARNSNWSCFGDEATSAMCSRANSHMASCQSAWSSQLSKGARSSCHVACSTSRASCRAASRAHSRPLRSSASCCCTSAEVWRVGTRVGGEISSDCTLACAEEYAEAKQAASWICVLAPDSSELGVCVEPGVCTGVGPGVGPGVGCFSSAICRWNTRSSPTLVRSSADSSLPSLACCCSRSISRTFFSSLRST
jgi:hypothetical protein